MGLFIGYWNSRFEMFCDAACDANTIIEPTTSNALKVSINCFPSFCD